MTEKKKTKHTRKRILFVCTGNTCRSPMAEAVLKAELKRRKIKWYSVRSAGLQAEVGAGMNAKSRQALTEAKIAFSENFVARKITDKMIGDAYAVIYGAGRGMQYNPQSRRKRGDEAVFGKAWLCCRGFGDGGFGNRWEYNSECEGFQNCNRKGYGE